MSLGEPATTAEQLYTVTEGSCLDCSGDIEGTLRRLPGVVSVEVSAAAGTVHVLGDAVADRVLDAATEAGVTLEPAGSPRAGPAGQNHAWWRQPQLLALATASLLWLTGFVAERVDAEAGTAVAMWAALAVGAWYPARSAWRALRTGRLTISTLLVVAASGAVALGVVGEAALLVVVFSLGEILEEYATDRARGSIRALMALVPDQAHRQISDGSIETVRADILVPGDVVLVRPGERIPTDGRVQSGHSAVDQSPVTGESIPLDVTVRSQVFAGTLNGPGALEVEVSKPYADTTLARIIRQVQEAEAAKGQAQRFADRFGAVYTPAMFVFAALVAVVPWLTGADAREWTYRALVVLVVSCSCALVISVPTSVVAAITRAARRGILIKGGMHLESLSRVQVVAFDKTGTLTLGRPQLTDIVPADGLGANEVLGLAAAVEAASEHPLATAIVAAARRRGLDVVPGSDLHAIPGVGVESTVDSRRLFVGQPPTSDDNKWFAAALAKLEHAGRTAVVLAEGEHILAVLAVADVIREDAVEIGRRLHVLGVSHTVMLTGDNDRVAAAITAQAGIDEWRAQLLPEHKTDVIRELRAQFGSVAMIGDGINDAPALATADVGIAMGAAGTDVALETADIALMADDLLKLPEAMALARGAVANLRQNIALSLLIVVVLITAAVAGTLSLTAGLLLNEGAALLIIANGLRLLGANRPIHPRSVAETSHTDASEPSEIRR